MHLADHAQAQPSSSPAFRAVLSPHRSLSPRGFLIFMACVAGVSFAAGLVFLVMGAWPVMGFFGLDVLLIYLAFRLNYRSGLAHELVEMTQDALSVTHVDPQGRRTTFTCNPYWARVSLHSWPNGQTDLAIVAQGVAHRFGLVLTDDERRDFADALRQALVLNRERFGF